MSRLREIFHNEITLGSDKWDPYFDVYETYFSKFVNKSPVVVEVGVQSGGSLQMWRKYFGADAKIIGIDIDESVLNLVPHYDRNTKLVIGNQESREFWDSFLQECPKIDIFIDDGGHLMNQQIVTFEKVFPHISDGGIFLCEDTHTSYMSHLSGGLNRQGTFIEYAKKITDVLNHKHIEMPERISNLLSIKGSLKSVHFYNSIVVFMKDREQEFKRVIVNK